MAITCMLSWLWGFIFGIEALTYWCVGPQTSLNTRLRGNLECEKAVVNGYKYRAGPCGAIGGAPDS